MKAGTFIDTAIPLDDRNKMEQSALLETVMFMDGTPPRTQAFGMRGPELRGTTFDNWWDGVVLIDRNGAEFSRKDVCIYLANKEGGAHVDPKLDTQFDSIRNQTSGTVTQLPSGKTMIHSPDLVLPTMRQIAAELLYSLDSDYSYQPPIPNVPHARCSGASVMEVAPDADESSVFDDAPNLPKSRPQINGKNIGRNDLCHCGSGKKYKKCCLMNR